jgi:hypothetical protein
MVANVVIVIVVDNIWIVTDDEDRIAFTTLGIYQVLVPDLQFQVPDEWNYYMHISTGPNVERHTYGICTQFPRQMVPGFKTGKFLLYLVVMVLSTGLRRVEVRLEDTNRRGCSVPFTSTCVVL